jgi:hypothetical protein
MAVLALAPMVLAAAPNGEIDADVRGVLTRYLRFSTGDLADLQRGRIVRHSIDTSTPGEVAVAGGVRVNASKTSFLVRVRDIARFKRGPAVLQIGRFSQPPSLDDLAGLTVDRDDFDLNNCRVGDCDVRLPAETIRRFQHAFDVSAPDAQRQATTLFKQALLDNVVAYESGLASGRITEYNDGSRPIRPIDEFQALLGDAPSIGALVPGLPEHLMNFPASRVAGAEDFLYWSKEKFGVAPFISVTHVTIVCPAVQTCVMTTKDVYSSRYFDASLAVSIASDAAGAANSFYLVYMNRSRANALKGAFAALKRSIVGRRVRGSLEESLRTIKTELEKAGEARRQPDSSGSAAWPYNPAARPVAEPEEDTCAR